MMFRTSHRAASSALADTTTVEGEGTSEDLALRELMVRYQDADAVAVEELLDQLSRRLLSFFRGWGASPSEAEDLLQDCWLRIHRARHTYRPFEPFLPWLFAIARHTRLDGYRRRRRLQ